MSDFYKWMAIVENSEQMQFEEGQTVAIAPTHGGGVGYFKGFDPSSNKCLVDVKGQMQTFDRSVLTDVTDDIEYNHEQTPDHRLLDRPELQPGNMVKIMNLHGAGTGDGYGVFVAYALDGKSAICNVDSQERSYPIDYVEFAPEEGASDEFETTGNDGCLSPMSFGDENRAEIKFSGEDSMENDMQKWMAIIANAEQMHEAEEAEEESVEEVDEAIVDEESLMDDGYGLEMDDDTGPEEAEDTTVNFSQTKNVGDSTVTVSANAKSMEELHNVLRLAGIEVQGHEGADMVDSEFDSEPEDEHTIDGAHLDDIASQGGECDCGDYDCEACFPESESEVDMESAFEGMFEEFSLNEEDPEMDDMEDEPEDNPDAMAAVPDVDDEEMVDPDVARADKELGVVGAHGAPEDVSDMIGKIQYLQDMGMSNARQHFDPDKLMNMPPETIKKIYVKVTGEMAETVEDVPLEAEEPMMEYGDEEALAFDDPEFEVDQDEWDRMVDSDSREYNSMYNDDGMVDWGDEDDYEDAMDHADSMDPDEIAFDVDMDDMEDPMDPRFDSEANRRFRKDRSVGAGGRFARMEGEESDDEEMIDEADDSDEDLDEELQAMKRLAGI